MIRSVSLPNLLALHAFDVCDSTSFNFVSWSISAEMGMYVIAPVVLTLAMRYPWGLILLAVGAMLLLAMAPGPPWYYWTSHFGVARALPSFLIGAGFFAFQKRLAHVPAPRVCAAVPFPSIVIAMIAGFSPYIVLLLIYALVACALAADLHGGYRPFLPGRLGQLTYSMYLLHPILMTIVISILGQRIWHLTGLTQDALLLATLILLVPLSYYSLLLFERPARMLLSGQRHPAVRAQSHQGLR